MLIQTKVNHTTGYEYQIAADQAEYIETHAIGVPAGKLLRPLGLQLCAREGHIVKYALVCVTPNAELGLQAMLLPETGFDIVDKRIPDDWIITSISKDMVLLSNPVALDIEKLQRELSEGNEETVSEILKITSTTHPER